MVGSLDDICLRYFVVLQHNTTASCNYLVHGLNILSLLSPDSDSALIQKPFPYSYQSLFLRAGIHTVLSNMAEVWLSLEVSIQR